jgi:nitrite reductase/ring-hydroxylating ferredoxin subunit
MAFYLELGGILFSVIAAVPGIIDYYALVPPESSAKKRATKHGLLNICVLFIFLMVLMMRRSQEMSLTILILIEGVGVIILTIAGWLGGTLVHRNQIGVDHRYAEAGKWKEETVHGETQVELKDLDLKPNQMKLFHVNDKRIVIGRTESGYVAFDDFCTHRGGCLADGVMICGTVQCPWHGSQFDVKTGKVKAGPAKDPIKTYEIVVVDQKYYLQVNRNPTSP